MIDYSRSYLRFLKKIELRPLISGDSVRPLPSRRISLTYELPAEVLMGDLFLKTLHSNLCQISRNLRRTFSGKWLTDCILADVELPGQFRGWNLENIPAINKFLHEVRFYYTLPDFPDTLLLSIEIPCRACDSVFKLVDEIFQKFYNIQAERYNNESQNVIFF